MRTDRKPNMKRRNGQSKTNKGGNIIQGKTTYESIADILERISEGFIAFNNEMNYTYVNERGGDLLRRNPEELIGKNFWQEYPEAEGTPFANAYLQALETQTSIQLEDYYEPWDRWFENRIYPSKDGLSVFFRDVTERKRTEESLRESEERYRTIYETSGVSIWEEDFSEIKTALDELKLQGVTDFRKYFDEHPEFVLKAIRMLKIIDVNEMTLRLYGAKDKNELLRSFETIQGPTNVKTFTEEFISLAEGETYFEGEVLDQTLQGEPLYIWRTIVFPKESDGFKSVLVSLTNITARKQAEEALRQSEERFRALTENNWDAIALFGADGRILYGSPSTSQVLGYTLDEFVGKNAFELIHKDDQAFVTERLTMSLQQPAVHIHVSARVLHKNGTWRWLEGVFTNLLNVPSVQAIVNNYHDFTERKQAESLQSAIYQISEAANKATDLDKLFRSVHGIIGQVMPARNFYIALYDSENDLLSFPYYVDEVDHVESASIPAGRPGRGMTEYVIRTGKPLLSDAANFEELAQRGEVELVGPLSPIWVGAPLIIEGQTIGVIAMQDYADPNVYTERELQMLEYVSRQVAVTIERTRLNSDIQRRNQILSALQESTLVLMERQKLTDVLQAIVAQIVQLMDTPNGFLYLVESDGKNLKMHVGIGISSHRVGVMLRLGEGLAGKIWRTGQPLVVQDYHNWSGRSRQFEGFEIYAMAGVPLTSGSQTIGVLGVDYLDASRMISQEDVDLLTRFAQLASLAIENAQFYQTAKDELNERIRAETALVEAEAKYRLLVERLPAVIYTSDLGISGTWHYVSPQIESLLGFTPEEWMSDPNLWYQQIHPDDRDRQKTLEESAYMRGEAFDAEYRIARRDGRELWVRDTAHILSAREGELPIVQGVLVDITERKRTEEALHTSEETTRLIIDTALDAVITIDQDGRITRWNDQAESTFGWTQAEAVGQRLSKLIIPHDLHAAHERGLKHYLETGEGPVLGKRIEIKAQKRDGSVFPVELAVHMLKTHNNVSFSAFVRDITARKQAEEALSKAHDDLEQLVQERTAALSQANTLLQTMLDHVPDHIFFKDLQSRFIRNSRSQSEMLGLSHPADVVGKSDFDFFPHAQQAYDEEQFIIKSGQPMVDFEEHVIWPDGRKTWVSTTKVPLRDEAGQIVGTFGIARDITERKRADEALRKAKDELEVRVVERTAELNITNEQLRLELNERKRAEDALKSSETRYRLASRATKDVIWDLDMVKDLHVWNENVQSLFGYTPDEAGSDREWWYKHIHPTDHERVRSGLNAFYESSDTIWSDEYRFLRRDGSVAYITDRGYVERDVNGKPLRMIGAMSDITARKHAEDQIRRRVDHLKALRIIDMTITASTDMHFSLQTVLRQAISQLQVDAADILLLNPTTHILEYSDGIGFYTKAIERSSVRIGEGYAGRAALERKIVNIHSLYESRESFNRRLLMEGENFTGYYGVPLIAKGEVKGVLEVFQRTHMAVDQEWVEFLESLAGQAGLAIDNATLFQNLQRTNLELGMAYESTLEGWSAALDLRDKETEGHTLRVTNLTLQLAEHMGLQAKDLIHIRRGALLHDIGKMGIPDRILLKPDNLTDEEWEIMRLHPAYAYEMLLRIEYLRPSLDIPYSHHEKWDGTGYPRGLKGEDIPLHARIFAVVDVYDALISDRPYRPAWTKERALEYIKSLSGTHFDPRVVNAFLELLNRT